MNKAAILLRASLVATCALALSGCLSMLGGKPATLYRFGQPTAGQAAPVPPAGAVAVFRANGTFQRESAGERILTITGGRAAYIAATRWVAAATALWDQALLAAFDADPGPVRIISRGEAARVDYVLRVDVRNFETHYDNGPKAAPEVLVRVRAAITRDGERQLVDDEIFEARVRASGNRASLIVQAYDQAVAEVLQKLVAWTNAQARPTA